MALNVAKIDKIPKDAVILSEKQALEYNLKVIHGWDKAGEVWSVKYGPGILASMGVFSGAYINGHYRSKLRLGTYGQLSSYLPIVALPAIMTLLFHNTIIQPAILLRKVECPLCIQTKSAVIQAAFAVGFPLILAPLSAFMFATRHFTYRIPSITSQPLEVFKFYRKITKPISTTLLSLVAFNALAAMYITHKEQLTNYNIHIKLAEFEKQLLCNE